MKFYDCRTAPSPRRVRIFLAEKGVDVPTEQVDLRTGAHFTDAFRAVNPSCTVPALILDDGTAITESMAICRYFEETNPEPPLMGTDARDRAVVEMWQRRIEIEAFLAVAEALRNAAKGLKGRALPGPEDYEQIPELAARGRARVMAFYDKIEPQLGTNEFVAGPRYTVADISALVAFDFAHRLDLAFPEAHRNLRRWHQAVSARPSAAA
ncbi:MAG: glutathione S-transferase family protein [Alphaproteobacteria bacterium]|jgi:glutathione S-transferase|nr:glutathione S-transferase family protein [Alphaproteobacteria bacterium]MDP6518217.1 glutathione S-transferase family protein [Alphaproteobacteria bacterium]